MTIKDLFRLMVKMGASDLFCRVGGVPRMRVNGRIVPIESPTLTIDDLKRLVAELANDQRRETLQKDLDIDFGLYFEELDCRFRVSIFIQRSTPSIVVRWISNKDHTFKSLNLPAELLNSLCGESRGLVLLTGSMGSGKTTTIASMIDHINANYNKHILTVEEPIEFTFKDKLSIINQRELGVDVSDYKTALRVFTLQSPDVIYIGNIRDSETMSAALVAAETGVLVLSTLHTINAPQTAERIVNFFPPHQHPQIRIELASLLKGVISLRLIPSKDGKLRVPAYESMVLTPTISRIIREGKYWELQHFIEDGTIYGMQSFTQSLVNLVKSDKITLEEAMNFADNKDELNLAIKGITH